MEEKGSASIEATISVFGFVMVMITIYLFIHICIVQAKIAFALDSAAKEMAQYSYLYHAFGVESMVDGVKKNLGEQKKMAAGFLEAFNQLGSEGEKLIHMSETDPTAYFGFLTGELSFEAVEKAGSQLESAIQNPGDFVKSMAALVGSDLFKKGSSSLIAAPMAKVMVKWHLEDVNLERYGVTGGYDGLNFHLSTIWEGERGDEISLVVLYEMDLSDTVPFFSPFLVCQRAQARAWLGGDQR